MLTAAILRTALLAISSLVVAVPTSALAIDYATLYARLSPSVVTVRTQQYESSKTGIRVVPGIGTGIQIEPNLILTAAHVIESADAIQIRFKDKKERDAEVVSAFKSGDVALLKLKKAHPVPVLAKLGDSDATLIGSPVFIIGSPFGIEQTLSIGYLSGRMNRGVMPDGSPIEFLQTDTAINPGNSGGPLFNENGEVIGIVSFILTKGGGFDGIGFASAINQAYDVMMNSSGNLVGFDAIQLTPVQNRVLNIPGSGLLIQRVVKGSIAYKLGLKPGTIPARIGEQDLLLGGDVILAVDCLSCSHSHDLVRVNAITRQFNEGNVLSLTILRDGQLLNLTNEQDQLHAQYIGG